VNQYPSGRLAVTSARREFQARCHTGLVPLLVRIETRRLASPKKMNFGSADPAFEVTECQSPKRLANTSPTSYWHIEVTKIFA
jgi:hypothetical protein